jgi:heat-inducible transcriptional repressor
MITGPAYHKNKIQFIQLSQVSDGELLVVIVIQGNVVRNKIIPVDEQLGTEVLLKLNLMLNTTLNGMTIRDINLGMIAALKEKAGVHGPLVSDILDALAEAIGEDDDEVEVYTSGTTNIFKYPELSDSQKASQLIYAFEEKNLLADFARESETEADETGIRVYIGSESPVQTMKDCSVVTATYELGDGMKGTIGIIGPKRMDYDKVVGTLRSMMNQLDDIYKKK